MELTQILCFFSLRIACESFFASFYLVLLTHLKKEKLSVLMLTDWSD